MSQNDAILNYLKAGHTITPLDALSLFGCFRLGARIHDLKQAGHNIETFAIEKMGKRFAGYRMVSNG